MNEHTGTRIRLARASVGWTQAQLAEAAGIDQSDVSRIERTGRAHTATIERLEAALATGRPVPGTARPTALQAVLEPVGERVRVDLSKPAVPVEWLIPGVLARGALTVLAGQSGAGKSMLTQTLAYAAAADELGPNALYVTAGKVWIVDAENGERLIRERLQGMGLPEEHYDRVIVDEARGGYDVELDLEKLERDLAESACDYLILDSWKSLWRGSVSHEAAARRFLNAFRGLAQRRNIGVLLIHHTTKEGSEYAGSGAIGATVEIVYSWGRLHGAEDNDTQRVLRCTKNRLGPEPPARLCRVTDVGVQ